MVNRRWENGDKLTVTMPEDFWLSVLDKKQGGPTAVMYGPLVMAFTTRSRALSDTLKSMLVYDWDEKMNISPANSVGNASKWWSYEGMLHANPDKEVLASVNLKDIKNLVKRIDDKLGFELRSNPEIKLKPFMSYDEGQLYYMYVDTRQSSMRPAWSADVYGQ